jgi:hypothetical protein
MIDWWKEVVAASGFLVDFLLTLGLFWQILANS